MKFLNQNQKLLKNQWGFRKSYSTMTALSTIKDNIIQLQ